MDFQKGEAFIARMGTPPAWASLGGPLSCSRGESKRAHTKVGENGVDPVDLAGTCSGPRRFPGVLSQELPRITQAAHHSHIADYVIAAIRAHGAGISAYYLPSP